MSRSRRFFVLEKDLALNGALSPQAVAHLAAQVVEAARGGVTVLSLPPGVRLREHLCDGPGLETAGVVLHEDDRAEAATLGRVAPPASAPEAVSGRGPGHATARTNGHAGASAAGDPGAPVLAQTLGRDYVAALAGNTPEAAALLLDLTSSRYERWTDALGAALLCNHLGQRGVEFQAVMTDGVWRVKAI